MHEIDIGLNENFKSGLFVKKSEEETVSKHISKNKDVEYTPMDSKKSETKHSSIQTRIITKNSVDDVTGNVHIGIKKSKGRSKGAVKNVVGLIKSKNTFNTLTTLWVYLTHGMQFSEDRTGLSDPWNAVLRGPYGSI